MALLTKKILKSLPPLGGTFSTKIEDKELKVKFFTPDASWTWFGVEFDPDREMFFGLVFGVEREWGYFSLEELKSIKGHLGCPVERDMYFNPCKVKDLKD